MLASPMLSLLLAVPLAGTAVTTGSPMKNALPAFRSARPVWPAGESLTKNLMVGFRASFPRLDSAKTILRATGSSLYRVFLNGEFIGHGPARGPHGWYRLDEIDLTRRLKPGENWIALEVAGYNVNSFYLLNQPSFLQAEVIAGQTVLASTEGDATRFEAAILPERIQRVQRYSFQRPFSEAYLMAPDYDRWRVGNPRFNPARLSIEPTVPLLSRRVPYSKFDIRPATQTVARGTLKFNQPVANVWKDRSLTGIGPQLGGYLESELEVTPSLEMQTIANATHIPVGRPYAKRSELKTGEFEIIDLGLNATGFLRSRVTCTEPTRLAVTFDEILTNDDVDFKRLGCVNVITYDLAPGTYDLESFEPYTLRYLKLHVIKGAATVQNVALRELVSPIPANAQFRSGVDRLNRLFAAGVETFRQNATDVFMDCPSRERAGWLCDSFFTARVADDLMGTTQIEENMFENYLLPGSFKHLPKGMLPMCYPSDHDDGVFIPNWSMWFVVQLEEYLRRSGDRTMVRALEPRVNALLAYFRPFQNSDGLLEKLQSWVFIEWSAANNFTQDVNYPSNMLFAEMLSAMGRMYNRPDLTAEADRIRTAIRAQSFNGEFFVDNAVRKDGKLQVSQNTSEVCQYFAFFFGVATPESHPKLWRTLLDEFGPQRKQTKAHPQVHPANAFVGNVLRLELLSRAGRSQQLLNESLAYQLYMVDRTGTLWENDGAYASCNHGFASHGAVRVLYRDILGLYDVDSVAKRVHLRFTDLDLGQCEGSMPTPHGPVKLKWTRQGNSLRYELSVPRGYQVEVTNLSNLRLERGQRSSR